MRKFERLKEKVRAELELLEFKVNKLYDLHFVDNYFKDCPCCRGDKELLRSDAKSFDKYEWRIYGAWSPFTGFQTYYTTEESYKAHLPKIREWEKEFKELRSGK